jgi:L-ribulose-5-phosphate 3-epimerase
MPVRPSLRLTTLPAWRPYEERFKLAAAAGFEGVELEAGSGPAAEIRDAAERAGVIVHSVHTLANWKYPLSSPDPAIRSLGIGATIAALEEARLLGADTVQLVPGRVQYDTSYSQAYDRSQAVIRDELLPVARQLGVILGVENVWNGFLLGPLEFVRYTDSFDSPFVRPYLDVGNVVFGRPEDWIDIAGTRIVKLHLKDFEFDERRGRFAYRKIGEGNVDWTAVRLALDRIGFAGWGTFAQAEHIQGRVAARVFGAFAHPPSMLRAIPGSREALAAVNAFLSRRLLDDVMQRYRRHVG